jgi:hypothetical protein
MCIYIYIYRKEREREREREKEREREREIVREGQRENRWIGLEIRLYKKMFE